MSKKTSPILGAKIKVVGVGGGGGNMIDHMISQGVSDIELIAANTDAQALDSSLANVKIQLGERTTRGLGAGMKPEVGENAAEESYDELKESMDGADIVFIATGMGGGTGTGATPVVARAAKDVGALTVCVVTKPFEFEGRKRTKLATAGIETLKGECDSIVVIPNQKLLSIVDKNLGIKESFKLVDNILARAVGGMSSVLLSHGVNDINLDFADVQTVMTHKGLAILGVGEAEGENAAAESVKNAIESPLLDSLSLNGAMGVLVHFQINPNFPLTQIQAAMDIIYDSADEDADVIFGTTTNESFAENEVKITIVATGFTSAESVAPASANTPSLKPLTTPKEAQEEKQKAPQATTKRIKIGTTGDYVDDIDLDYPTFLRNQMD